jgi:hypothetical protein
VGHLRHANVDGMSASAPIATQLMREGNGRKGPKPDMRVQSTNLCGLNHSDELPPLPIDPRTSAERRGTAMEIGTAVTGPNEVANIDIRRRCETS